MKDRVPHAVAQLRSSRLARSLKPFLARGGIKGERCSGCRLLPSHCLCSFRPIVPTHSGICLLMADIEPLKPSNTGWLIADVVPDTFAFSWTRTAVDPGFLELLKDPKWQPYVVFPQEFVAPERVVQSLQNQNTDKRPLFILLDATWAEARKMFRKSPYLNAFPVLTLNPAQASRYQLRRSRQGHHFCTIEVASICFSMAEESHAAQTLQAYLDVYTHHYLQAKNQLPAILHGPEHSALKALASAEDFARWPPA